MAVSFSTICPSASMTSIVLKPSLKFFLDSKLLVVYSGLKVKTVREFFPNDLFL